MFGLSPHRVGTASLLSLGLLALFSPTSKAACLPGGCQQNGLVFSEASRNFKITNVVGTGTTANPFVIYQDVWGLDISVAIDGLKRKQQHTQFNRPGFAVSIVSRNLTGGFWRFYDHELQEIAGRASHENDGLSFAQGIGVARPYKSTHYARADEVTDVRDFINFYGGTGVKPGESVRFNYFVTDTIPNQRFFIRQRPDYRPNAVPTAIITPVTRPLPQPAPQPLPQAQPTPQPVAPQPQVQPTPQPAKAITPAPLPAAPIPQPAAPVATPPVKAIPVQSTQQTAKVSNPQTIPEPTASFVGSAMILLGMLCKRRSDRP